MWSWIVGDVYARHEVVLCVMRSGMWSWIVGDVYARHEVVLCVMRSGMWAGAHLP